VYDTELSYTSKGSAACKFTVAERGEFTHSPPRKREAAGFCVPSDGG
jgi:hypothetical protein